jgi:DnaJ-class molecular chaperone
MIKNFEELNYYELLQISFDASSFEIRKAYKNLLSIYDEGSLATYSLFSKDERKAILAKIEKAFLTLVDNEKRLAYDNALVSSGQMPKDLMSARERKKAIPIFQVNKTRNRRNNLARIRKKIQEKGVKELSGAMLKGGAISGETLRNLRESLGIELEEVFQVTKISPTALNAIERDDITNLPPTIYLKSFLKAYAEILQLDAKQTVDGYLKNIQKD